MSDDLISRKELWEEIARLEELARRRVLDTPISSPCYQRYNAQLNERTNLKHIIADAKTAYDLDKVVERLEERKADREKEYKTASLQDGSYMLSMVFRESAKAYERAIEIVKGGGVDE